MSQKMHFKDYKARLKNDKKNVTKRRKWKEGEKKTLERRLKTATKRKNP